MSYTLFHCHSDGSLLDGYSKPKDIVKRAKELGMTSIGISDHGNCFNHVAFYEEAKKNNIKPILGIEFYFAFEQASLKQNRDHTHMVCFAKNEEGLHDLWRATSYSNEQEIFYYKPRLNLRNWTNPESNKLYFGIEEFAKNGNIFGISGHQGSFLSDCLFADLFGDPKKRKEQIKKAYGQYKDVSTEFYKKFLKENWLDSTCQLALELQDIFGKGNFFIELQNELNKKDKLPLLIHPLIVDCLREVSKQTGIPSIASSDPHYAYPEQSVDQRAMVSINMKETEQSIQAKLSDSDNLDIMVFFGSDNFFIHSYDEMQKNFTKEELNRTNEVANQISDYNLIKKPELPKFKLPKFDENLPYLKDLEKSADKFLMYLAIEGAKKKQPWIKNPNNAKKDYWDRINYEIKVISKAGLADYLLIVWDFLSFCRYRPANGSFDWEDNLKKNGEISPIALGKGRGSVGGSLICYFLDIHDADSLKYNLLFNRFFNEARINDLMDIDCDIEISRREEVIEYLRDKYGYNNIGQITNFGRIQGKSSIKDLFRIKGLENGLEVSNKICEFIPDESKIIDQIQEVRDSGEEYGIVQWSLDNSEELSEYYKNEEYKPIFDQAIRIEGTKRNISRHASGYVITLRPIEECFPMVWDTRSKKKIIAFDMRDVAKLGGVKLDLLGLVLLDKLKFCQKLVNERQHS